jgi:AcrR family transcriptional regulator
VIVETALRVADANGLEGVSLTAVAAELDCATPSLYNHVNGLEDLLDAVQIDCTWQLANHARDAAVGRAGRDGLLGITSAWRAFARRHPARYAAVFRKVETPSAEHIEAIDALIRTGRTVQDSMGIGPDDVPAADWVLRSYLEGFIQIENREAMPEPDETFELGLDALLGGLQRRAADNASHS